MKRHYVVLFSLWAARLVRQPTAPVGTASGLISGEVAHDGSHARYLGIPYAVYKQRFQPSEAKEPWEGVLDAYEEHIRCLQRFSRTYITGIEDCLTLNVYTPIDTPTKLRPVMVFIHGGGFRDGSGSPFIYGPEYLVKHDVILVTINYRLEILGFLCLGIKEAPGNVGLKDQVEALKWIKRNIEAFGGDSNSITLFGESAGSASVMYHVLSPMSKGLFHRAIMQSGSAVSPWSFQYEPLKTSSLLAKQIGYNSDDPNELYKIFINKAPRLLLSSRVPRKHGDVVLSENIFVPCVEKKIPGVEPFLTDIPYNLIVNGHYNKVPIIIGYNNFEGYMFVGKENDTTLSKFNFYDSLPRDLRFQSDSDKYDTAKRLKEFYVGIENVPKTKEYLTVLSKYEGDIGIIYPVIQSIDHFLQNTNQPIFAYKFCYDGWMNVMKFIFGFWNYKGATHADDLFYIFKLKITLPFSFFETNIINKMSTMWTNFAKYGNPTLKTTQPWLPITKYNPQVFVIDKEFSTEPLWDDKNIKFWNETYFKYRRKS